MAVSVYIRSRLQRTAALFILVVLGLCTHAHVSSSATNDVGVDEVIKALKEDIRLAQGAETGEPRLQIDRVELELTTVTEISGEAGVKLLVPVGIGLDVGGAASKTNSQVIKLTLIPEGDIIVGAEKDHGLSAAIFHVKNALRNALNDPPPLKLKDFVFEMEFAVQKSAGGGISFLILNIAGAKQKKTSTHQMRIYLSLAG